MFGRRHRGESVKTGQEQGIDIDDKVLAVLLWHFCETLKPSQLVFNVTDAEYRHTWHMSQKRLGLEWVGPPHCLRHTKPSEDSAQKIRTIDEILKRGRWTQVKSMARYSKPHALTIHLSRLPEKVRQAGDNYITHKETMLAAIAPTHPWGPASAATCKWLLARGSSRANSLRDDLHKKG